MKPKKSSDSKEKTTAIKALPLRGIPVPTRRGKIAWPKQRKPPSEEKLRRQDAEELIAALVDAAHDIGTRGIVENYSRYDFHLYPRHIADLFTSDHAKHAVYAAMKKDSQGRALVPWPWREGLEAKSTNEFREKPFEIIGLLMRRVLDGDSAFFTAIADSLRDAKREAIQADSAKNVSRHPKGKTRAGKVVAEMPDFGMLGDADWFSRLQKPLRTRKAPLAVWQLCKARHDNRELPPTRREVRDYLEGKGISCRNLPALLSRMNLSFLEEGKRRLNRSI